MTQYFTIQTV